MKLLTILAALLFSNTLTHQQAIASTLNQPDFEWQPESFKAPSIASARYIDYKNGADTNAGTRNAPWKHHPWDEQASANARLDNVDTYFFKRGVTYHGKLVASRSGTPTSPVTLSSLPTWGSGNATLAGSMPVQDTWQHCNPEQAKLLPEASKDHTWCIEIHSSTPPQAIWQINNDNDVHRINLAREPNWSMDYSSYDPRIDWNTLEVTKVIIRFRSTQNLSNFSVNDVITPDNKPGVSGTVHSINKDKIDIKIAADNYKYFAKATRISNNNNSLEVEHHRKSDPVIHYMIDKDLRLPSTTLQDASIWIEPRHLPIPITSVINRYGRDDNAFSANFSISANEGPVTKSRYYLEGPPGLLDRPGEFAWTKSSKQQYLVYLRLHDDTNPNESRIEIGHHHNIIEISNHSHINISGLEIRSNAPIHPSDSRALHAITHASGIQLKGNASDINIHHNLFNNLSSGIAGYPINKLKNSVMNNIVITDNDMQLIDGAAIALGNGHRRKKFARLSSRLRSVNIHRNRIRDTGMLTLGQRGGIGAMGNGVLVHGGELVDISHNIISNIGGAGIQLVLGAEYKRGNNEYPLLRGLIHHNKVINTLLAGYDFGGISAWTGGPAYIFNNISGNTVGYLNTYDGSHRDITSLQGSSYGASIYMDGLFKGYIFNNIVWGTNNDPSNKIYNAAGINEAAGFLHYIFHNSIYGTRAGLHRGAGSQNNRNYYLSNALENISEKFILQRTRNNENEYDTLAFHDNVFSGESKHFGQIVKGIKRLIAVDFDYFTDFFKNKSAIEWQTGIKTKENIFRNPTQNDFRPIIGSALENKASKVFVPWSLSRVVGEWNFYRYRKSPDTVRGENMNMNAEWQQRYMFHLIPRNDLECPGVTEAHFADGILEDWTQGALDFSMLNKPCRLSDSATRQGYPWQIKSWKRNVTGKVLREERDSPDVSNEDLTIEAVLTTNNSGKKQTLVSKLANRGYMLGINNKGMPYAQLSDGKLQIEATARKNIADGIWHHLVMEYDRDASNPVTFYIDGEAVESTQNTNKPLNSLSNRSDLIVGGEGPTLFEGRLDYLRIAKSTLKSSATNIAELYNWQFNGPASRDIMGTQNRKYAGAMEP